MIFLEVLELGNDDFLEVANNLAKFRAQGAIPEHLLKLENQLNRSSLRLKAFDESGFYSGKKVSSITTGLDLENYRQSLGAIKNKNDKFKVMIDSFNGKKSKLISSVLEASSSNVMRDQTNEKLVAKLAEAGRISHQINVLRDSITSMNKSFEDRVIEITKLNLDLDNGFDEITTNIGQEGFSIAPKDLVYKAGQKRGDIRQIAQPLKVLSFKAGDQLHLQVNGRWSPTCLARKGILKLIQLKWVLMGYLFPIIREKRKALL